MSGILTPNPQPLTNPDLLIDWKRKHKQATVIEVDGKQKICKNELINWACGFTA